MSFNDLLRLSAALGSTGGIDSILASKSLSMLEFYRRMFRRFADLVDAEIQRRLPENETPAKERASLLPPRSTNWRDW